MFHGLCSTLCLVFLLQVPEVQVTSLAGRQHQGTIESFTGDSITIKTSDESITTPLSEIMQIQSLVPPASATAESTIEVRLTDQTRLKLTALTTAGQQAKGVHAQLGNLQFPTSSIASIRFAPPDEKIDGDWLQLLDRPLKKDAVAVRKGGVLDHLDGIIGSLGAATMQFQMDGDDIAVKREKIFGLIFSKRESTAKKATAQLELTSGDRLSVKQIAWNGSRWMASLAAGVEFEVPGQYFRALDYQSGKVSYLSDLEPRNVELTPFWKIPNSLPVYEYRRDQNFDGSRISLAEVSYSKGLAIHSQCQMTYRLGADYRRFQAVAGIGDEVPRGGVDLIIKGDGKILHQSAVNAVETSEQGVVRRLPPQDLDLDVTNVVELQIFVGFGSDKQDVGDRLYLGNARVIR